MFALSKLLRRSHSLRLVANTTPYSNLHTPLRERIGFFKSNASIHVKSEASTSFHKLSWRRSLSSDTGSNASSSDIENELSCDEGDDIEGAELELDKASKRSSELFKAIMSVSGISVATALDKWVEEGKEINRTEFSKAMLQLRRRRMYGRALQMAEWLEEKKPFEFTEIEYASRLNLIAKIHGMHKGESYIEKIPESLRGELVYRTLLSNYVAARNVRKAETIFDKIKDLGFARSSFAFDKMLILYKRADKKKIADLMLLMEKEKVTPSPHTYKILLDTKGSMNDIAGMEAIMETMRSEGAALDVRALSIIARHYAAAGVKEKAEQVLRELEGESLRANRHVCKDLLGVYAMLGREDEVKRVWEVCVEEDARYEESLAAIIAFGKIGKVKEAEEVFEMMLKSGNRVSSSVYAAMLRVYVEGKMLSEGKDLVKRLSESGCNIGALTWDALIKFYVEVGDVEKADASLSKAGKSKQVKLLMSSFMYVMEAYARRGDVYNTEKIFMRMRQAGYQSRFRQFQVLVMAYVNGKAPAYGMKDRMKADNIFPNTALVAQLAKADPFKKTPLSDLLD